MNIKLDCRDAEKVKSMAEKKLKKVMMFFGFLRWEVLPHSGTYSNSSTI